MESLSKPIPINHERMAKTFEHLVRIDSVSREEGALCTFLRTRLMELGLTTFVDDAAVHVNGQTGNLIAVWAGTRKTAPLLLCAHMDTVEPGRGVRPIFKEGAFFSAGDTILGADDKSAIAIILEVLQSIIEQQIEHGPLEVVFTICEEIGLFGAKHLDYDRLTARMGFVLDTRNPAAIITSAPSSNRLTFRVHGKAAHAGSSPEKGINAIAVAAAAIARLQLGRIDHETTCNIGHIQGGLATNIVPDSVVVEGEARSHDDAKLQAITATMVAAFEQAADEFRENAGAVLPRIETEVRRDFDRLHIDRDHPVVQLACSAAQSLGQKLDIAGSGGGSDANVFAGHGITTAILGTGMENVHTVQESIRLADMVRCARLLMEIIRLHAGGEEPQPS